MFNPLNGSINDAARLAKARARVLACLLFCCLGVAQSDSASGDWPDLRFSADALEFADIRLSQVGAALAKDGSFQFSFEQLQGSGEPYVGNGLVLEGGLQELSLADDALDLRSELTARGLNAELTVVSRAGNVQVDLVAKDQPLASLRSFQGLPQELEWMNSGAFAGKNGSFGWTGPPGGV